MTLRLNRRGKRVLEQGIVFNIQKYNVHDGSGIRTIVFLKGCPLRCLWCSNPESQQKRPQLLQSQMYCQKCGQCVENCPNGALSLGPEGLQINRGLCSDCGSCVPACLNGALTMSGKLMTVDEVLWEVRKDEVFYRRSRGGVTLSGGEPTMQPEFARSILQQCHINGISTAVETCGYQGWECLYSVLKNADEIFYDIKEMDPIKHKKFTGVDNDLILDNARRISLAGMPFVVRMPIIPGLNTDESDLRALGRFAEELPSLKKIELLPYHRLGLDKYGGLGYAYQLPELRSPGRELMERAADTLRRECGVEVNIGAAG